MRKPKKGQGGFTLLELVIAIALTSLVTGAVTMTFSQVFNVNTRTTSHMIAVRQVQNAGKLVSEDILMANSVETGESSGFPLTLNWIEIEEAANYTHEVIYKIEDMSGGLKKLQREHYINSVFDSTNKVAEYIDPDQTSCVWDGEQLTFTVTATVSGHSETHVYEVKPRPGSI